jgi:UDP-N-acetylmuramate dehydrogenase
MHTQFCFAGRDILLEGLRGDLSTAHVLAAHTTWRVGGVADVVYAPADRDDLAHFLQQLPSEIPIFWLGLGSNVLIRDGGIRGVVILTSGLLNTWEWLAPDLFYAEAGVSCAKVARTTAQAGYSGVEFLAGIPGTVGGALTMNAGAWGGETWQQVAWVKTMTRQGNICQRDPESFEIAYRHVKGLTDEWFLAAAFHLKPNATQDGLERIRANIQQRNEKQPIGLPSCGSVFRNPPKDYAARLIESLGWKGKRLGGAYVSEKHANFIINSGTASALDIEMLIQHVQQSVDEHYGIRLIPEVRIVGEFIAGEK